MTRLLPIGLLLALIGVGVGCGGAAETPNRTVAKSEDDQLVPEVDVTAPQQGKVVEPGTTEVSSAEPAEEPKILGSIEPIDIATNKQFLVNKGFRGQVFLMLNLHKTTRETDYVVEPKDELSRILHKIGGDGFYVQSTGCEYQPGGFVLSRSILFDKDGTHYGYFPPSQCGRKMPYFAPYWYAEEKEFDGHELECLKSECDHEFITEKNSYTFSFAVGSVEVQPIRPQCADANVHQIVVTDSAGGSLRLKDVLRVAFIEHDADGDGLRELYVLSMLTCARWLRVIKIVPDASRDGGK